MGKWSIALYYNSTSFSTASREYLVSDQIFFAALLVKKRFIHRLGILIHLYIYAAIMASSSSAPTLSTPITTLLGIKYPIILAGMARTSSGPLAAAVSNAGGLGVIGGLGYTPKQLREIIHELKANLASPDLPFGVDLALPQVGGSARKTNHDYTHGQLDDLITVTIDEGAKMFVSAVGVPPKHVIERLHKAGILVMNMVGHPKHAVKALDAGVDCVCAQGGEGGG